MKVFCHVLRFLPFEAGTVTRTWAVVAVLFLALGTAACAQSAASGAHAVATGKMSFDVISIKRDNNPNVQPDGGLPNKPDGGLFYETNRDVLSLLSVAYNLSGYYYREVKAQLPQWALTDHFDIQARAAGNPTPDQMRLMVQSLLAGRFKFTMHYEDRQTPFYAMLLAKPDKLGAQIRPYTSGEGPCAAESVSAQAIAGGFPAVCGLPQRLEASQPGLTRYGFRNVTIEQLATYVTGMGEMDRPVLDRTGLSGAFDLVIEYDRNANNGPQADTVGPTIFEAMKDQLGLKLEEQTGPVKTFVVDHIEEPSPN